MCRVRWSLHRARNPWERSHNSIVVRVDALDSHQNRLAMATEASVLPFVALPFLLLMNDRKLLREHTNGWISNTIAVRR